MDANYNYVLYKNGAIQHEIAPNGHVIGDNAYSAILGFLPSGLRGLSVAALTAAIVASLAGKVNSISTIFTMDIYQKYIKPYLFTTYMLGWKGFFYIGSTEDNVTIRGSIQYWPAILKSIIALLVYIVALVSASVFIFRKKDILS